MGLTVGERFQRLLDNSRFWVLVSGIVFSFMVAGFVQLLIPAGPTQTIRIEQFYGFISLLLLYLALLASPLTKVYPGLLFKAAYLHARRAIGVLAFYYAFLHAYISLFKQLSGFSGLTHLNTRFTVSLWLGIFGLAVLFVLTLTSVDWAVKTMGFKNWKMLQRLVYLAGVAILAHIAIVGTHYDGLGWLSVVTGLGVVLLLGLEVARVRVNLRRKSEKA